MQVWTRKTDSMFYWIFFRPDDRTKMKLQADLREFIELLNSHGVKYVIVGGYAVAYHGFPRYTGDIDFFIEVSQDNAERMSKVVAAFGFGSTGLTSRAFLEEGVIVQLGVPPNRIDIVTGLTGVDFDEAWASKVAAELDGIPVHFLSKDVLIKNKAATGRARDQADIEDIAGTGD